MITKMPRLRVSVQLQKQILQGDTYHADDFTFSGNYDDDEQQELTDVTDDDVTFHQRQRKLQESRK